MKNTQKFRARLLLACLLTSNFMAQAEVYSSQKTQPTKSFYQHYYDKTAENLSYYANAFSEAVSTSAQAVKDFLSVPANREALYQLIILAGHAANHIAKEQEAQNEADRRAALKAQKSLEIYQEELRRQQEREKAKQDTYHPGPMRTGYEQQQQEPVNIDPFAYMQHDYAHQQDQNVYSYGPMRTGQEQYAYEPNIDPFAHIPEEQRK